jgi:hypothetical protein
MGDKYGTHPTKDCLNDEAALLHNEHISLKNPNHADFDLGNLKNIAPTSISMVQLLTHLILVSLNPILPDGFSV